MSNSETQPVCQSSHVQSQHDQAVALGQHWYTDAQTGFLVFTELYHLERGTCCLSACRHCPWDYKGKP